jgi:hypothetical protein
MSLSLATLPNPADEIRRLRQENETLREQVRGAQDEANGLRREVSTMTRGIQELRTVLTPLYQGLRHIFGEIDELGVESTSTAHPQKNAVWDSWKQKLGGLPAKAIDALLVHGEMNRTQLRIHVGCATGSITDLVYKLNQAGIINKNGGKISLKEL